MIPSLQDITDSSTDSEMGSFPTIGLPCDCGKDERVWFYGPWGVRTLNFAAKLVSANVRRNEDVTRRGEKLAHMAPL
jgi:hypothetical protein